MVRMNCILVLRACLRVCMSVFFEYTRGVEY
jgi:hypothetical protein